MSDWKWVDVFDSDEFDEGLRRAKVPEHLIQESRAKADAIREERKSGSIQSSKDPVVSD